MPSNHQARASWLVAIVGALAGFWFAAVSALTVRAALVSTRPVPRPYSIIVALVAAYIAFLGFRAALFGKTDEDSKVHALHAGVAAALLGLLVAGALYLMFGPRTYVFVAHCIGLHPSQIRMFRLLLAAVGMGFGAGFALRMRIHRDE